MFMISYSLKWKIGFFAAILTLLMPSLISPPFGLTSPAFIVLCLMIAMALLWILEIIPLEATALLPLVYLPISGVMPIGKLLPSYSASIVFLFLGGFILGAAIEKQNLHKRIAYNIISVFGINPKNLILGVMVSCAFISMWVNNTTTTIMMIPLALAIVRGISVGMPENFTKKFNLALLLGVAYGSSIGGTATIIGSTPNIFLKGFLEGQYGISINFVSWLIVGLPIAIVMLLLTWLWLSRGMEKDAFQGSDVLTRFGAELGKMQKGELLVAIIFFCTAMAWIFQKQVSSLLSLVFQKNIILNDTIIALLASVVLFSTPVSLKDKTFVMDWQKAKDIPWGMLLLFGGGLALSVAISETKLSYWFGSFIKTENISLFLLIGVVTAIVLFLTEINSNTATAATFLPILAAVANTNDNIHVAYLIIPAAIAASCAFMMPISTPPNAIAYATNTFELKEMVKQGVAINVVAIIIITVLSYYLINIMLRYVGV